MTPRLALGRDFRRRTGATSHLHCPDGGRIGRTIGRLLQALLVGWALCPGPLLAQPAATEVHGTSDGFAGSGVAIAWAVLRGTSEETTLIVLRVAADPGLYSRVVVDGVDPFSKERQAVAGERPIGAFSDIRMPRARFADFPRTELRFSGPTGKPALVVYYLGVPDTTPEFATGARLEAHLADRLRRLQPDIGKKP